MAGLRRWGLLAVLGAWMCWAPGIAARPFLPPAGRVFAGLTGGTSIARYERLVHRHPAVFEVYITWNTRTAWLATPDRSFRSRLALHLSTASGYGRPGVISPEAIALGRSDRFLITLGRNLAHSGRIVYVRIMGEMNGYWNAYSAFSADGAYRGVRNAPFYYKQAWRRTVLILRGGPVAAIDRRLRALHLPRLRLRSRGVRRLAHPRIAFLWVPQDAGSPEIAANAPGAYWPGSAYVDWVGTDFYASYPNFGLLNRFYATFTGKPFVLSEWALYGADDPRFVRALFSWVASHPRVRMLNYYQGFGGSSPANLARYPRSRAALVAALRSRRFLAYPPEYAHPRHPGSAGPPLPPVAGAPPAPGPPLAPPQLCLTLLKLCIPGL